MISLNQNGFTLIEVLIAMAILAIGILALSSIQSNSALNNKTAREVTQAVFLAQQRLEKFMNRDYDDIDAINGTVSEHGEYTVVRSVNATNNTKEINVVVRNQKSQYEFNLIRSNCY